MRHDELYVADLVDSTRAVCEYLDGISRERWDGDRVLRDAILYRLLLLGEIASAIPDALRESGPDDTARGGAGEAKPVRR
jgi:uncharacterized protein with HEPN domain